MANDEKQAGTLVKMWYQKVIGRQPRSYTAVDLIQFVHLKKQFPDLPNWLLVKLYDYKYPERTNIEKINSLKQEIKNLTE